MKGLITLICAVFVMPCMAATGKASATADDKAPPLATNAPAEMSLLYPRIGQWNVTIRTLPGKSSPKGGVDHGVMTNTKGPGGFSVVQNFWSRGSSGHVVGQSYTWWDARAKTYKSVWCDNLQGCAEFTTSITGNAWTVEMDSEAGGEKIHTIIHASMSADHTAIHEEVANAYDGGPSQAETVSDYKRIAAPASVI
ncbi:hypothetical protein [Dyella silvatica]|uniref:hypothetical protein n=1 Tax=Dyella silvatica TaxID=2992128 RepID=UPI0022581F0F|nr:hypothetical protein [Dyella silvatica]